MTRRLIRLTTLQVLDNFHVVLVPARRASLHFTRHVHDDILKAHNNVKKNSGTQPEVRMRRAAHLWIREVDLESFKR
jgi:hypothetical protein